MWYILKCTYQINYDLLKFIPVKYIKLMFVTK